MLLTLSSVSFPYAPPTLRHDCLAPTVDKSDRLTQSILFPNERGGHSVRAARELVCVWARLYSQYDLMGGVYTRVLNVASLQPGDHVCIWDYSRWPISYQHHGIVWVSGTTAAEIRVCHVWSPLEGFQEAQADSCARISTLEEFLDNRKQKHLRLVEYHTSGLREVLSRWGEVHLSKADLPEVVLARCKFLLGLGRGDFNLFTQNCEHPAHWCMTGEQWCKQTLTKAKGRVPFEKRLVKEDVDALVNEVEEIKASSRSVVSNVLKLDFQEVLVQSSVHWFWVTRAMNKSIAI